jgi:hypothetical protein
MQLGLATLLFVLAANPPPAPRCVTCHDSGKVTCGACDGRFRGRSYTLACAKRDGGCDGVGVRACPGCRGVGHDPCDRCGGDGAVRRAVYRTVYPGFRVRTGSTSFTCPECRGAGTQDCHWCAPLRVCSGCGRGWKTPIDFCPFCQPMSSDGMRPPGRTIEHVAGRQICPRCDGLGECERRGPCPACKRGFVSCPDCRPPSALRLTRRGT